MTKPEFINELKDILEVDELEETQNLSEMDEFDSLAVMSITALAFSKCGKKISGVDVKAAVTIRDLIALIGTENLS